MKISSAAKTNLVSSLTTALSFIGGTASDRAIAERLVRSVLTKIKKLER